MPTRMRIVNIDSASPRLYVAEKTIPASRNFAERVAGATHNPLYVWCFTTAPAARKRGRRDGTVGALELRGPPSHSRSCRNARPHTPDPLPYAHNNCRLHAPSVVVR